MLWEKKGILFCPDGSQSWARTHAMIPTPFRLNTDVLRIYFTCCDQHGIGRPGYIDVCAHDPTQLIQVGKNPLLDVGSPGTFDENGVLACSVIRAPDGRVFMYYVGFELGQRIRYRLLSGLAISEDGGETFYRHSPVPILERSAEELYFRCGPFCLDSPSCFRLWYVAGSSWTQLGSKSSPEYDIRYAESHDGITWPNRGEIQISVSKSEEYGFGRPYLVERPGGGYRMFYSVRRRDVEAYRLGYAESDDGKHWKRMDERLNLDVTPGSFDSDAIMYAAPVQIRDKMFLFYNGNNFGRDGIAVARLVRER